MAALTEKDLQRILSTGQCSVVSETPHPGGAPTQQRTKAYRRPDLGNRYFRSAWEANIARYLNWLIEHNQDGIESWDYECDEWQFPVKRGARYYTCDFKITRTDQSIQYWEVKGYMDRGSRTKLKRMKRYYPDIYIVLITNDLSEGIYPVISYRGIAETMKCLIAEWE